MSLFKMFKCSNKLFFILVYLEAANILRDTVGNIKLTDFGVSKQLHSISCASGLSTTIGSPYWMAPEVIKEAGYGQNADLW